MTIGETSERVDAAMSRLEEHVRSLADGLERTVSALELVDAVFRKAPRPLVVGTMDAWLLVSDSFADGLGYSAAELESVDWRSLVCSPSEDTQVLLDTAAPVVGHLMRYRHRDGHCVSVVWQWSDLDETGVSVAMGEFLG